MLKFFEGLDDGGEVFGEKILVDVTVDLYIDTVLDGDLFQLIH